MASKATTRAPALARPQHQLRIRFSRQGKRSELLQSSLIDPDNDNAIIVRARSTKGKTQIQSSKLDVLEKKETGTTVAANPGKGKQEQACHGDQRGQREVDLAD